MDMKNLIGMILMMGLVGCGNNTGSVATLKADVDTCMTHVDHTFTEYDLVSICGTPSTINNGSYTYHGNHGVYVVSLSINSEFESLWTAKDLSGSAGVPYSYSMLQAYVDQIRITLSNQNVDIYDTASWGNIGNTGTAIDYISQINAFKAAQGSQVSLVTGITLNGASL